MDDLSVYIREAFDLANTDKGYYHQYETMYSYVFNKCHPNSIFEIGVKNGASILAWQMLFPSALVGGMDIKKRDTVAKKTFNYIVGDSTSYDVSSLNTYDIVIDDGSHDVNDQVSTFLNFKNKFNRFYIIEDINFIKNNSESADAPLLQLIETVKQNGFNDYVVFDSLNTRKQTKSLVIRKK